MAATEQDREKARDAIAAGFRECKQTNYFGHNARQRCDCDLGAVDGCKARIEAIAQAIAAARRG